MKKVFKEKGFIRASLKPVNLSDKAATEIQYLQENFKTLPNDPYANSSSNRSRAYSNLIIFPWDREVYWMPVEQKEDRYVSSYWQGKFNPEHKDAMRHFSPLNVKVKESMLLKNLILHDFDLTFLDDRFKNLPIYVGVHFVKLQVSDKNEEGISSPNLFHRDGEAFTFAHLFNRKNVKGGVNYIASTQCANTPLEAIDRSLLKSEFEMIEPFDGYGVCDKLVSHYVSPIKIQDETISHGVREIILIDFSAMKQKLVS